MRQTEVFAPVAESSAIPRPLRLKSKNGRRNRRVMADETGEPKVWFRHAVFYALSHLQKVSWINTRE